MLLLQFPPVFLPHSLGTAHIHILPPARACQSCDLWSFADSAVFVCSWFYSWAGPIYSVPGLLSPLPCMSSSLTSLLDLEPCAVCTRAMGTTSYSTFL